MASLRAGLIEFHDIGPYLLGGVMLAAALFALRAASAHSLRPFPGGFALRVPWQKRAILGLVGLQSFLLPLLLISDNLWHDGFIRREDWGACGFFTGMCWLGAIFFFWQSGPRELVLDETQRTYRRSEGWPLFRRVSAGPLSDLSGVWAESNTDHNSYSVYIGWQGKRGKMLVEQFRSSLEGAEYFAAELAATLAIPRLDGDPSAPSLPYRVPADRLRPQWIEQDGRTVSFQEWAKEQDAQESEANDGQNGVEKLKVN